MKKTIFIFLSVFLFLLFILSTNISAHGYHPEYYPEGAEQVEITSNSKTEIVEKDFGFQATIHGKIISTLEKEDFFSITLLLILSFFLGIIHSLTPGHGKAIIATYLAGTKAKYKDALTLGLSTGITHVFDVLIVMVIVFFIFKSIDLSNFTNQLSKLSALLIIGFGVYGLRGAIKEYMHHKHHEHSKPHSHPHTHEHKNHEHKPLLLGIFTGLAPCPMAWILFLLAVSLNKLILGFLMVLAFSLGVIITITSFSLAIIKLKSFSKRDIPVSKFFPIISYLILIGIGIYLLFW
jgi:ABC-type nickel/cobalt efflux system permease component RcnA